MARLSDLLELARSLVVGLARKLRELVVLTAWASAALVACGSPVPNRPPSSTGEVSGETAIGDSTPVFEVELLPAGSLHAAAPVVRVELRFPWPVFPTRAFLVGGDLSESQMRDIAKGNVTQVLARRQLRLVAWRLKDPRVVALRPLDVLELGQVYTVAIDNPPSSASLRVDVVDSLPLLRRVWPPLDGGPASSDFVIYCGDASLGPIEHDEAFEPFGRVGRWQRGVGSGFDVPTCVRWTASYARYAESTESEVPPPLVVFDDGTEARLEPAALSPSSGRVSTRSGALQCLAPEVPVLDACVEVQDDRIVVRPPDEVVLWAFDSGRIHTSSPGRRFVVHRPVHHNDMVVASIHRFGETQEARLELPPEAPRPHIIINEVYSDALGSETTQEWVELFNDGASSGSTDGFTLEDSSGVTVLPPESLQPGQFALVVSESFLIDDGLDPPVDSSVILLRVPRVGSNGLANAGESLALRDATGQVVSRFPALPARAGVSNARVTPEALDDDPNAFGLSPNGAATPGVANGF